MWQFKVLGDDEPERNPHEAEFFQELDVADKLVRENVQNSLDARMESNLPVTVRFTFGEMSYADNRYFDGLISHLDSSGILTGERTAGKKPYLLIEDFNTKGLDGPLSRDETNGIKGNYLNFWWGEGESDKGGKNAGRWGLGKTVYHVASSMHSFFGLTIRASDRQELLLGKAVLKAHKHTDGRRYNYFGYYLGDDGRAISNSESLSDFKRMFAVSRMGEPGLSILIPMLAGGIAPQNIIRSAIIHYFYPVMSKDLIFQIITSGGETNINNESLGDIARQLNWTDTAWENRDIQPLLAFLEQASGVQPQAQTVLENPTGSLKIEPSLLGDKIAQLQQKYQSNQLLLFRIPVPISAMNESPKQSFFDVFIQRDDSLKESDEFYIRSGITIPDVKMLRSRNVRALLSARDDIVSTFLGDAETPAHTKWEERNDVFRGKYKRARDTLRFIQSSMREIVKILDYVPPGIDPEFLKGIFSIPKGTTKRPEINVTANVPSLSIERIKAGFRIAVADKTLSLPTRKTIEVAYDTQRGNPFARYNPFDFDLTRKPFSLRVKGGRMLVSRPNKLEFEINKQDFAMQVTGFDENRDIVVSVQ